MLASEIEDRGKKLKKKGRRRKEKEKLSDGNLNTNHLLGCEIMCLPTLQGLYVIFIFHVIKLLLLLNYCYL